ncbi:MAG: DUF975 family protein [Anaerotignum sp.]|nr:DUF975 family protein [Anaerotignum sp.]
MKVAADFRKEAREALQGKWFIAVLVGLAVSLLGVTGHDILTLQFENTQRNAKVNLNLWDITLYPMGRSSSGTVDAGAFFMEALPYVILVVLVVVVFRLILGSIVAVGYAKFNLDLVDGEEAKAGTLFDYLPQWKTMVVAGLLQTLYILLWMLLFIIPGIVAAYRYAMTSFILAENPELTASEAINHSKELMDGNKWRLFCLGFSFIGWSILCGFTLGIGYLWLTPYEQAANAAFYRDITRPLAGEEHAIYLQETILGE